MSITVRLIFWGLIGFVPNEEGHKGMSALLVDPTRVPPPSATCPAPAHVPVVYMLHGECEGNCIRKPEGTEGADLADRMGFDTILADGRPLQLAWLLSREEIEILRNDDDRVKFRQGFQKSKLLPAPKRFWQKSYFSWVPSMDLLTGGQGEVREDCLRDAATCPLHARFEVRGGSARACHLFHSTPASSDGKATIDYFDYTMGEGNSLRTLQRVVADAVEVEVEVEGESVDLRSWGFPTGDEQQRSKASARLRPDSQGRLTLVVANVPQSSHDHTGCDLPHSATFFHLLAKDPALRTVRKTSATQGKRLKPGSCEAEIVELARITSSNRSEDDENGLLASEQPHATTACDGGSFP